MYVAGKKLSLWLGFIHDKKPGFDLNRFICSHTIEAKIYNR